MIQRHFRTRRRRRESAKLLVLIDIQSILFYNPHVEFGTTTFFFFFNRKRFSIQDSKGYAYVAISNQNLLSTSRPFQAFASRERLIRISTHLHPTPFPPFWVVPSLSISPSSMAYKAGILIHKDFRDALGLHRLNRDIQSSDINHNDEEEEEKKEELTTTPPRSAS